MAEEVLDPPVEDIVERVDDKPDFTISQYFAYGLSLLAIIVCIQLGVIYLLAKLIPPKSEPLKKEEGKKEQ